MAKKRTGLDLGDMIDADAEPVDTGIPQRGAEQKPSRTESPQPRSRFRRSGRPRDPDPRTDQISVRIRPRVRERIEQLADELDAPIADVFEWAVMAYRPTRKPD